MHDQKTLTNRGKPSSGTVGPPPPAVTYRILCEDGSNLTAESGNVLRKEKNT